MADELRGSIGGWEFKSYVLGTMFYRYISENLGDEGVTVVIYAFYNY